MAYQFQHPNQESPKNFLLCASLILLLLAVRHCPSLSERCNQTDKKVLHQIKKALNGPSALASWDPRTDCCEWYGVECDSITHRIRALTIFANEISSQIPHAIGDLPFLETLVFQKFSNLAGNIPEAITKLNHLNVLFLNRNNLSGPVPAFLSKLKNLTHLDLSFNNLSGPIPSSLSLLPKLRFLYLHRNHLTGPIPDSFGKFPGFFPDLDLSHNQLSGKIPSSLLRKYDTAAIDLSSNKLEGDLSVFFNARKSLIIADFSRNLFQFDLSSVQFPKSLSMLDL